MPLARAASRRLHLAVRLPRGAGVVARADVTPTDGVIKLLGVAADDVRDLPRVRARPLRRLPALGALRGRRHGRRPGARLLAVPASRSRSPIRSRRSRPLIARSDLAKPTRSLASVGGRLPRRYRVRDTARDSPRRAGARPARAGLAHGARSRRWRATWTTWDWVGRGHARCRCSRSLLSRGLATARITWYVATGFFKERMLDTGSGPLGALAIGLGILPLVAGSPRLSCAAGRAAATSAARSRRSALASVRGFGCTRRSRARTSRRLRDPGRRAEPDLSGAAALQRYRARARTRRHRCPALHAARCSRSTSSPRRRTRSTCIPITRRTASRSPPREPDPRWPAETIETALILVALGPGAVLSRCGLVRCARRDSPRRRRRRRLRARRGPDDGDLRGLRRAHFSDRLRRTCRSPPTGSTRRPAASRRCSRPGGQRPEAIWQLEFWNPSIERFWSVDGSAPGRRLTPEPRRRRRHAVDPDPGAEFAVVSRTASQSAAPKVGDRVGGIELYRLGGRRSSLREHADRRRRGRLDGRAAPPTRSYHRRGVSGAASSKVSSRAGACFRSIPTGGVLVGRPGRRERASSPGSARSPHGESSGVAVAVRGRSGRCYARRRCRGGSR